MISIARVALLCATTLRSALNMTARASSYIGLGVLGSAAALAGCHADENDAAGQAEELSDPIRRANAISNIQRIYSGALADSGGDRSSDAVRTVTDAVAVPMNDAFLANPSEGQNRLLMLEVMKNMRDPRTIPALIYALDWRPGVNEDQAIRAAQALVTIEVSAGKKAEVVAALGAAYEKITQNRGVDNRLRVAMLRSLGNADHPSALPILIGVATNMDPSQNFQFNRLAAQQLGTHAGEESVAAMVRALYIFPANNPRMRMNDIAAEVLVRIGQPAVGPVLETLRGNNGEVNEVAEAYIAAVGEVDSLAAEQLSVRQVVGSEATFTLGKLGFAAALDPLLEETRADDMFRRVNGAIALVSLIVPDNDRLRIREAMVRVFGSLDNDDPQAALARAQLIAAMAKLYDPSYIDFFTQQARDTDLIPQARFEAVKGVAMLADKQEAEALQTFISRLDRPGDNNDDPYLQQFQNDTRAPIAAAIECDENVACYIGKLDSSDVPTARKAAAMLGRLGVGNAEAVTALVERLGHSDLNVRFAALYALDHIATDGSQAAINRIRELQNAEEGRAIWTQFSREALPIQARLRARLQQ